MKLWQYGVITVLIIGAWYVGDVGGYNAGYDFGYIDGSFDEGWHAAVQLNEPYTALGDITFSYLDDAWTMTAPNYNGTYTTYFYDSVGETWNAEGY